MSTPAVNPVPQDMHTVTAHIIVAGASDAIEFYKKAFNAVELARMPAENGKLMHAMIRIGDTNIMMADENPEWKALGPKAIGGTAVTLHMYVPDVDAAFKQAVDAGGAATMPPTDMFWGDRYGMLTDPFGHSWAIASHIRDMSIEEMTQAAKAGCP
ncbi:MAG: VOC family protein [Telluria sp.]